MKLGFHVDRSLATPLHVQLSEQIHLQIHSGQLPPGQRLPTVRSLAIELGLNANTVARVYRELQDRGFLELERGVGTFVAREPPESPLGRTDVKRIRSKASQLITLSRGAGLSFAELTQLIENLWKEME
ncbi:MAG: GntR family transcriptional regulator [Vulcanimicrobiota bacterium]